MEFPWCSLPRRQHKVNKAHSGTDVVVVVVDVVVVTYNTWWRNTTKRQPGSASSVVIQSIQQQLFCLCPGALLFAEAAVKHGGSHVFTSVQSATAELR